MNAACKGRLAPPGQLKSYTKFLADYQMLNYDKSLEIPGIECHYLFPRRSLEICLSQVNRNIKHRVPNHQGNQGYFRKLFPIREKQGFRAFSQNQGTNFQIRELFSKPIVLCEIFQQWVDR